MTNFKTNIVTLTIAVSLCVASFSSHAQSGKLHHLQSQALLSFCSAEVTLLNGALSAREFDMAFMSQMIASLKTSIEQAKKHVDRSTDLLDEKQEKLRPKFEKLRGHLVDAQRELASLVKDVAAQVKPYMDAIENSEEEAAGEAPPVPDWALLKRHVGWIAFDLKQGQKLHRGLAKKLRLPKLRTPRKPKGSRN
jgi:hypothetical protein